MSNEFLLDFQFRNSPLWVEYFHKRYLTLEEIKKRLPHDQYRNWESLCNKIDHTRKQQGHPFPVNTIDKFFWFFPADCLLEKISDIEHKGTKLFEKINSQSTLKVPFTENAAIEEAITSAIYEGANSTRAKARQLIADKRSARNRDEWMLLNNHAAMTWIKQNLDREVDLDLIREIHAIVTRNTLEGDGANYTGRFRDDKVFAGPHEGIQFEMIEDALTEVIELTTRNQRWIPTIMRGAILHYFIGYIHPFFDGNGGMAEPPVRCSISNVIRMISNS